MNIRTVRAVCFSATGNTRKVVTSIAKALSEDLCVPMTTYDFTTPVQRKDPPTFDETDLVVFGTPVYAGRVPNKVLPLIPQLFQGNGALAIPVVTFGNRNFDNGLIELRNTLEELGFHTIAGAAFVATHAFSDRLAPGRPDAEDMALLAAFASGAAARVRSMNEIPAPIAVRGDTPVGPYYTPLGMDGKPAVFLKAKPKTDEAACNLCGKCVTVCPMGSISAENPLVVSGLCIKCQACIRSCPTHAKYFDDPAFLSHVAMLESNYTRRAEPEIFL
ncbi:MAG: EFR1 family ferrodoxin [Clostridiales bacterium]|nr:EFR1 family ferrodoxin [Clostridiales bacterium]